MSNMNNKTKSTPFGGKNWFITIFFGLVGQIAWMVENMYFATFAQDIFANSERQDLSYIVTALMVIFSAITATVTTIFAGGLCDKVGKRKPFISIGYIIWGITIMLFALIPMKAEAKMVAGVATMLVVFDCVMTLAGSTANDAAFNAWIADVTDSTNRGKVNAVISILPVAAVVIIFVGLGSLYNSQNESNWLFFTVLGIIPIVAGITALFVLKDAPDIQKNQNPGYLKETFFGFRRDVIRQNKMMYVCLAASCIIGISQQTFFSYLINFITRTLGFGDSFVIPVAVIIVLSAVFTGICGVLYDRVGRKHFYFPLLIIVAAGTFMMYCLKFIDKSILNIVLYAGGTLMLGALLSICSALNASFQDYIPKGCEGRFQGVRMCFTVMIPMIVGPIVSTVIGLNAMGISEADFAPPYTIFLSASVIALLAFIPIYFVRKDSDALRTRTANK